MGQLQLYCRSHECLPGLQVQLLSDPIARSPR